MHKRKVLKQIKSKRKRKKLVKALDCLANHFMSKKGTSKLTAKHLRRINKFRNSLKGIKIEK